MRTRLVGLLVCAGVTVLAGCAIYSEEEAYNNKEYQTEVISGDDRGEYKQRIVYVTRYVTTGFFGGPVPLTGAEIKERLDAFEALAVKTSTEFCNPKTLEWRDDAHLMVRPVDHLNPYNNVIWSGGGDPPPGQYIRSFHCK